VQRREEWNEITEKRTGITKERNGKKLSDGIVLHLGYRITSVPTVKEWALKLLLTGDDY